MDYASKLSPWRSSLGARNDRPWMIRHLAATMLPLPQERGIAGMIYSWLEYAEDHRKKFDSSIQGDGFLGPRWVEIGNALIGLLNGDIGRLDGGTLDHIIRDTLDHEGL